MTEEELARVRSFRTMSEEERLKHKVIIIDLEDDNNEDSTLNCYHLNEKSKKIFKAYIKELLRKEDGRI